MLVGMGSEIKIGNLISKELEICAKWPVEYDYVEISGVGRKKEIGIEEEAQTRLL